MSAVPPIMLEMAHSDLHKKYDTASLKRMLSGAAPIAPELIKTIQNRYNIVVSTGQLFELFGVFLFDPSFRIYIRT